MDRNINRPERMNMLSQNGETARLIDPNDITLPSGYRVEAFIEGLNAPGNIVFINDGELLISESGLSDDKPRVLLYRNGQIEVVADNFITPLTGVNYLNGNIYVAHRGFITLIREDGTREDILSGLYSDGDFTNNGITFGPDNKMYFGVGTATNSGVVGVDNLRWLLDNPSFHDYPSRYILLNGQNFETNNVFSPADEIAYTGAFSPYGIPNMPFEIRKGTNKATGCVMRANMDGTELEQVAWGLRNPVFLKFDRRNFLFASNHGYDVRGSRPIANALDEFLIIEQGIWYGWPDYTGGEPVTSPRFSPEGGPQLEFLLTNHPNIPPRPFAVFPPHSTIMGFDFDYSEQFGNYGDIFIAEFGRTGLLLTGDTTPFAGTGHRISRIDTVTRGVTTFAINRTGFPASLAGGGGFGRPADVVFGPDGAMYIVDSGSNPPDNLDYIIPNTGVIWRIFRE